MPTMKPSLTTTFNANLTKVKPTNILVFDREVSAVPGIVKLTVGEPDFPVPAVAKQAAIQAIEADDSHYAPGTGSTTLRQAISHFLADRYDLHYQAANEIAVTIGATEAIYASLFALINPGDEVLIPTPTFPLYATMVEMLGGQAVTVPTAAPDFVLTPAQLKATLKAHPKLKAIVLNYPANPTGVTYSAAQLKALATILAETNLIVISDEIYSELLYTGHHVSIAQFLPGQTLILNGASKAGAMTGYRIGFIAGPAELMQKVNMVHSIMITAPSDPAMAAAVPIFGSEAGQQATLEMKAAYQARRDFLTGALTKLGFEVATPNGAFYLFAKLPAAAGSDDVAFATRLAKEGRVATIPGSYFGAGGEGYLRLSYATSMANLELAVTRLTQFLAKED
ncbi:aminotransferase class I/II-fold pyridoxal phosphate-dependent enzyme [Limosilactobacillus ingluviei]|uniref:aminotransferase class I/II-fold pyridoxal phosphate-dependent enzyme n=1 Tax=Limosilactobacillus ingluviei TaxID=148604 RepID=UPI0019582E9F|nr:aminotransferase class I/II-fold pyridoxal phosphate-dependent enzyme [Limosilactobacillus ingluviei]MBM6729384.1 aminotransferase class I/II-fold pyridoxal phosphate-dependent enzyme [Limosilactobacillus ingluviei]